MRKALIAVALLACAPLCGQPSGRHSPSVGKESGRDKKDNAALGAGDTKPLQRGTKESPIVVDTQGHIDTPEEAYKNQRDKDHRAFVDMWTVGSAVAVAGFTGILMIIGSRGVRAANKTLKEVERQANLMQEQLTKRKSPERLLIFWRMALWLPWRRKRWPWAAKLT